MLCWAEQVCNTSSSPSDHFLKYLLFVLLHDWQLFFFIITELWEVPLCNYWMVSSQLLFLSLSGCSKAQNLVLETFLSRNLAAQKKTLLTRAIIAVKSSKINTEQQSHPLSTVLSAEAHSVDMSQPCSCFMLCRTVRWNWTMRKVTAVTRWTDTFSATPATWSTSSLAARLQSLPPPTNSTPGGGRHLMDRRRNCKIWTLGIYLQFLL